MYAIKIGDVIISGLDISQIAAIQTVLIRHDIKHFIILNSSRDERVLIRDFEIMEDS